MARRPADAEHPYGHGRAEAVAADILDALAGVVVAGLATRHPLQRDEHEHETQQHGRKLGRGGGVVEPEPGPEDAGGKGDLVRRIDHSLPGGAAHDFGDLATRRGVKKHVVAIGVDRGVTRPVGIGRVPFVVHPTSSGPPGMHHPGYDRCSSAN